jgi:SAM-dependent methyltransferase
MSTGVSVLQSWSEVGDAIHFLSGRHYRRHINPMKCWDLRLISVMVDDLDRSERVADLGAATLGGVRLLHQMGFRRIVGFDLEFTVFDRALQMRDWLGDSARARRPTRPPYRLRKGDLLKTGLSDGSLGAVICLSVIEHGVDLPRFFAEMARVLRPGGRLYVSTDYWEPKLDTGGRKMFGLPWTVFCRRDIEAAIEIAAKVGLVVDEWSPADLSCDEAVVHDADDAYTFAAVRFRKA